MQVKHAKDVEEQNVKDADKTTIQVLISSEEAPNFAMRRFVMKPGGFMPNHTNLLEHEQFVVRGHACININGRAFTVMAGDVVFIPQGAPHWYVNNGNEDFVFLCIIPNRKDEIRMVVDDTSC